MGVNSILIYNLTFVELLACVPLPYYSVLDFFLLRKYKKEFVLTLISTSNTLQWRLWSEFQNKFTFFLTICCKSTTDSQVRECVSYRQKTKPCHSSHCQNCITTGSLHAFSWWCKTIYGWLVCIHTAGINCTQIYFWGNFSKMTGYSFWLPY